MKAKFSENNARNHQQNSKTIQLSDLTELTDQETEMVVGGWGDGSSDDWGSTGNSASSGSWQ